MSQELGWLALLVGRRAQARELFEGALSARPGSARALAGVGDLHKFAGEWDEALPYYQRALEADPNNFENHLEYAEYLDDLAEERPERRAALLPEARDHLRRAIELNPANPEAHAVLGATYAHEDEDAATGVPHLERAQALLPSNAEIRLRLGRVYAAVGRRSEAEENLKRVLVWAHDAATREAAAEVLAELQGSSPPGADSD